MSEETTSPSTSTAERNLITHVAWDHLKQRYVPVGWYDENRTRWTEAPVFVDPVSTRSRGRGINDLTAEDFKENGDV